MSENHVNDIVDHYRCLKTDLIGFTETQMKPSDSTSTGDDTPKPFNMNFNSSDDMFLILVHGCKDDIAIIKGFDINGIPIISLRKDSFSGHVFTLMLFFQKQATPLDDFCKML